MPKGAKAKYGGMLALLSSALLCTAAAAAAATAEPAPTISPEALVGSMKMKVKQVPMESMPQPSNPYAGKEYAGCEGGYCPSADFGLELKFYKAADKGDVKAVRKLLGNKLLNITRNIVPDSDGFARVVDVAVWAASNRGHLEVMKVLLKHPGVKDLYKYEDGHILDLAAMSGHEKMVQYLLAENMPVGANAMAHAAHYNHTNIMSLLMTKPMDLKATMQAISGGGSPQMAKIVMTAMKLLDQSQEKRPNQHDFKAEFAQMAAAKGNYEFLKLLFADYEVPWTAAQSLVKAAAENGDKKVFELIMQQKSIKDDKDELEEAVGNGLKVAAETGQEDIAELLVEKYPEQAKEQCKAAVFRAMKYGHFGIADALTDVCQVDKNSAKLQEAKWLGDLAVAARKGDADTVKSLLQRKDASQRIAKLQYRMTDPKTGKKGPSMPPHPINDPLVMAAKGGHMEVVKQLATFYTLCAGCAAAEAARKGHAEITKLLATGPAVAMMQDDGSTIDNALRTVAYSMEEANWDLVEWMVQHHDSKELGPYFLTAIAQEGKINDLNKMLDILKGAGAHRTVYFKDQVHSAKITAALSGHVELLLKLEEHADPLTAEELAADKKGKEPNPPRSQKEEQEEEHDPRDEL